jgi:two-component system, cell cycle response regulator DivK
MTIKKVNLMREYKTILVVDDNGINRLLPGLILRPFGFSIYECENGFSAIQLIKKIPFSAALLDISMPGMSGINVLKSIRADALAKKMMVIAYTSVATENDQQALINLGFDAILLKPITSDKLLKILSENFKIKGTMCRHIEK